MLTKNRIIAGSVLIAIGFWIVDSIIDVMVFSGESFLDELILHPSAYEVYIRWLGTAFILIPGIIVSRMYARQEAIKESFSEKERHLREAQELGRIGSWEFDVEKKSIEWTDETYTLYERDKKLGPPSLAEEAAYYTPEQASLLKDDGARAIETGRSMVRDVQVTLPSGKTAYYHTIMQPRQDHRGRTVKLSGVVQDITENTRLGEKLKDSEVRYRRLFETAQDAILILNGDTGQIIDANPFIKDLLGYSMEELLGKNLWEIGELKDTLASKLSNEELHRNGYVRYDHLPLVTKDGRPIAVEVVANVYQVDHTRVIQCNIRDITERQKMADAFKAKDENLRLAQENAHIGNWDWDPLTGALYWAEENYRIFGLDPQKVAPSFEAFLAAVEPGDLEAVKKAVADALANKSAYDIDMGIIRPDGTRRTVNAKARVIFDASGKAIRMVGTVQDITDRKRAEVALRQSEMRYRSMFEQAADNVLLLEYDDDGPPVIADINASALMAHGYSREEIIGKPITFINPGSTPEITAERRSALATKGEIVFPAAHRCKDGSSREFEVHANLLNIGSSKVVLTVAHDITGRKRAEEERQTFARLESVGILAGGIAHDFNNLLTGILGNIQLAQMNLGPESTIGDRLLEAEKASLRARDLTQQLLTFARGGAPVKKTLAPGQLIRESAAFALRGSKARCEFSMPDDLLPVEADEGQISQVINNLVINADQAMPEGGTIQIEARNLVLEEGNALSLPEGKYIRVSVEDHGIGIPDKYLNRIFEPYFTTKEKGHGLGLAAAYSVIKNHGGKITVDSKLGSGAIFRFYLPASKQPVQAKTAARKDGIPLRGKGKILVMDDEQVIRTLLNNMLTVTGYEAELAKDGDEAVELYRKAKEGGRRFDAAIMDLTIPGGMGGKEAVQKVLEIDPAAKVIVSSGYANDPIMAEYQKYGFRGVIAKPFAMKRLTELLASLLTDKTR